MSSFFFKGPDIYKSLVGREEEGNMEGKRFALGNSSCTDWHE